MKNCIIILLAIVSCFLWKELEREHEKYRSLKHYSDDVIYERDSLRGEVSTYEAYIINE